MVVRCPWASDESMTVYHDTEWGVPSHNDGHLFEMLVLEGSQAGLSWRTILNKRNGYREAFAGFDVDAVAAYGPADVERLVGNPEIVRHQGKIEAAISNARAALAAQAEFGSLDAYLWGLAGGDTRRNAWTALEQIPAVTAVSEAMSKDLRRRGFRFVGPTTCYAFMQATGMVNDHLVDCFRYGEV